MNYIARMAYAPTCKDTEPEFTLLEKCKVLEYGPCKVRARAIIHDTRARMPKVLKYMHHMSCIRYSKVIQPKVYIPYYCLVLLFLSSVRVKYQKC